MCNNYHGDGATRFWRQNKSIALFVKSSCFYRSTKAVRFFEPDKSSKRFNVILTYSNLLMCSSNGILFSSYCDQNAMCISDFMYCKGEHENFCMTMFCSEDDARVENLHLGQSVTSLSILFSHLKHSTNACVQKGKGEPREK